MCRVSSPARGIAIFVFLLCLAVALPALPTQSTTPSGTQPLQQPPAAQKPAESIPAADPQNEETRGDLLMTRKQYADAATLYQSVLSRDPRNPVLMNKIGIAYHQLTQLDQAKKFYERAIKADKTYPYAYNNLGALYYDMRKYRQAVRNFTKAIELRPDLAAAHSGLGCSYFARKKYAEAIASFQRAIQLDPEIFERKSMFGSAVQSGAVADRAAFYFFLAKAYALESNAERCAHYLRKARDEGYQGLAEVAKDPAFGTVIKDPLVQEVLAPPPAAATRREGER